MKADLKEKVMLALLITMAFAIVLRCHSRKTFRRQNLGNFGDEICNVWTAN